MKKYINQTYDEERSLYGLKNAAVENCVFAGPADGESPLKECSDIAVTGCKFELRYPFWHIKKGTIVNCELTDKCRAALWYDDGIDMSGSTIAGVKAFRECKNIRLEGVSADSEEFCWKCSKIVIEKTALTSVYPFFECSDMDISSLAMKGKYSFQYTKNSVIRNSALNTKDAFWHSKNVTVEDSEIVGEYLGWYSENLKLVRCKIKGTQPFCYAKNLVLEDCELEDCDFAFEKSSVNATVKGHVISVKNPLSGVITLDSVGEIIMDDPKAKGRVEIRK